MTKVAEDYRSAPERSSHPLLAPQGSDLSRWWEQESPRTLAGLGPFSEHERSEHLLHGETDVLDLLGAEGDDEENEPTQLLTRSLLMSPTSDSKLSLAEEVTLPPEPELGLPHSDSRLKLAISTERAAALDGVELTAARALELDQPAKAALTPKLNPVELDEFARKVSRGSVLHRWMQNSSPRASAPSLLVTPKAEPSPTVAVQPANALLSRATVPSLPRVVREPKRARPASHAFATLARRLERNFSGLSRARTLGALAGVALLTLLLVAGFSRLRGARASTQATPPAPVPALAEPAPQKALSPATSPPPAPAFITLRAGAGAEGALVELVGDGHLRAIDALPARIPANRAETYRVQARRAGYRDFSLELVFNGDETEKDVPIELSKVGAPSTQGAPNAARMQGAPPAAPQVPRATNVLDMPAAEPSAPSETLVRVKPNDKTVALGSASLSVNSIPISTVIVDGRAQGSTPRVLQVTPGSHTVVFVHPELGRRLVSVEVNSGTTAVAAVRF